MRVSGSKKKLDIDEWDIKAAKLCYFYGWAPCVVEGLDCEQVETYWQLITRLEVQDMLMQLTISDWPNMKNEKRSSVHRKLFRDAYPENNKPISLDEFIKKSGGSIGG